MKAVTAAETLGGQEKDFYISNLAPINHRNETPFRAWDAVMLVVLFVEIGMAMRLILAN
jgi:hypothetical protein